MDGAKALDAPRFVRGDFEKSDVQPDQRRILGMDRSFLHEFDFGIHEGKEFFRVFRGMPMSRQGALIGHGNLIELPVYKGEGDDTEVGHTIKSWIRRVPEGEKGRIGIDHKGETRFCQRPKELEIISYGFGSPIQIIEACDEHARI